MQDLYHQQYLGTWSLRVCSVPYYGFVTQDLKGWLAGAKVNEGALT